MAVAEMLSKIATRAVDPRDHIGGGRGTSTDNLSALDVVAALSIGGAGKEATELLLLKYVDDRSVQERLFYRVYDAVVSIAAERKWKVPVGEQLLRRMTRLAIAECISPGCCPTCGGRKEVWQKGKNVPRVCPTCNGIGIRSYSEAMLGRAMNIERNEWQRKWMDKYRVVRAIVSGFEQEGLRALARGLGNCKLE